MSAEAKLKYGNRRIIDFSMAEREVSLTPPPPVSPVRLQQTVTNTQSSVTRMSDVFELDNTSDSLHDPEDFLEPSLFGEDSENRLPATVDQPRQERRRRSPYIKATDIILGTDKTYAYAVLQVVLERMTTDQVYC